jgi:hypothetical protein
MNTGLYEVAQQLKTAEYKHPRNAHITIKRYEWVTTASNLTWQEAKAKRRAMRGARIYRAVEAVTA